MKAFLKIPTSTCLFLGPRKCKFCPKVGPSIPTTRIYISGWQENYDPPEADYKGKIGQNLNAGCLKS